MKFWQKAFFCVLFVFLLGVDIMGYVLTERSYALNLEYALTSAKTEQQIIRSSVIESISLVENNYTELNAENLKIIISPYAGFYHNQGIYFQLYQDDTLVFNNIPNSYSGTKFSVSKQQIHTEVKDIDGTRYCFIAGYLDQPHDNLQFVYIKDMQSLTGYKAQIIETFTIISIVISLFLSVIILVLLISLTRPFRKLNAAATEISQGHYNKRVDLKSHDEIGDFARSFNLMADHTEKHINELSQMTENKQSFIDNLAHEIRTPITAIVGYSELLKYANCSEAEKETAVDHIISQSKRIQNMAYKLMDLAYMGNENIVMLPIELESVLQDVKAALNIRLREKQVNLYGELGQLTITGDEELIKSLFINLIENAVKASPAEGKVEIRGKHEDGGVLIEITDYGKGMDKKETDKVIEPFYRVDKSRSRSEGGVGLGLAICARICQIHNAALNINSEIGSGTTVNLFFTTP